MGKKVHPPNTRDNANKWKPPLIRDNVPTKWNWVCHHHQHLTLKELVDIGAFTYINAKHGVTIEENVQIGSHCSIYSISTIDGKKGEVVLRRNARIGSHTVIMPNVTIGENSIIGAFSFVNKDVPSNVLAYGIPVNVIRELNEAEMMVSRIE